MRSANETLSETILSAFEAVTGRSSVRNALRSLAIRMFTEPDEAFAMEPVQSRPVESEASTQLWGMKREGRSSTLAVGI